MCEPPKAHPRVRTSVSHHVAPLSKITQTHLPSGHVYQQEGSWEPQTGPQAPGTLLLTSTRNVTEGSSNNTKQPKLETALRQQNISHFLFDQLLSVSGRGGSGSNTGAGGLWACVRRKTAFQMLPVRVKLASERVSQRTHRGPGMSDPLTHLERVRASESESESERERERERERSARHTTSCPAGAAVYCAFFAPRQLLYC